MLIIFLMKWQGTGALKVCSGTDREQARKNNIVVSDILSNKEVLPLYGVINVDEIYAIHLDSKNAKAFIGQKLCHLRKPSAYKVQLLFIANSEFCIYSQPE